MKTKLTLALVFICFTWFPTFCSAQFGRPVIIPRAPVPHVVPHIPHTGQGGGSDNAGTVAAVVLGIVALVVLIGLVVHFRRRRPAGLIRITLIPPGEAPEEIRRAWVGLELPLLRGEPGPRALGVQGVLSGQANAVEAGYVVDGKTAVGLLASHAPMAAAWWRENAPHVVRANYQLIFPASVCERMDDVNA